MSKQPTTCTCHVCTAWRTYATDLEAEHQRLRESVRKAHERLYPWGSNIDYRAEPDIQKVLSILEHALEDTRGLQT